MYISRKTFSNPNIRALTLYNDIVRSSLQLYMTFRMMPGYFRPFVEIILYNCVRIATIRLEIKIS